MLNKKAINNKLYLTYYLLFQVYKNDNIIEKNI